MNQNKQILAHLKTGAAITPLEALRMFSCFRLAGRIYDLKKQGWPIISERLEVERDKRVGYYRLSTDKNLWPDT